MTVKDVIILVCDFVGETDLFYKLKNSEELTESEQKKVELMTRCFNLVFQEIASDYLPLLCRESVDAENMLTYSSLKRTVVQIYEIKNRFGMNLRFKLFDTYVEFTGKAKSVVYSYLPQELELTSTLETKVPMRVIAYGIASEYLLIDGVGEDADIWENRYKESLFMLSRKHGEHILPKRNWL